VKGVWQRRDAIAAAVAVAGVLSACGETSKPASNPRTVTIPVTMTQQSLGQGASAVRAIVHVRVGGGPSVPVLLDTGSPGLRVLRSAIGSGAALTSRVIAATFGGGETFVGPVYDARVTVGSLSTRSPIAVQAIERVLCPQTQPGCNPNTYLQAAFAATGAVGIMGIDRATSSGSGSTPP